VGALAEALVGAPNPEASVSASPAAHVCGHVRCEGGREIVCPRPVGAEGERCREHGGLAAREAQARVPCYACEATATHGPLCRACDEATLRLSAPMRAPCAYWEADEAPCQSIRQPGSPFCTAHEEEGQRALEDEVATMAPRMVRPVQSVTASIATWSIQIGPVSPPCVNAQCPHKPAPRAPGSAFCAGCKP
jgi:hypothetical protein